MIFEEMFLLFRSNNPFRHLFISQLNEFRSSIRVRTLEMIRDADHREREEDCLKTIQQQTAPALLGAFN